jgi:membrane-bound inhibitor of C-type lysozyme
MASSISNRRIVFGLGVVALLLGLWAPEQAVAQTFAEYICDDGTPIGAAFIKEPRSVSLQVDGKSVNLPLRIAISGTRYKKSGVTFWIKRDKVYFKRPRARETVCRER